MYCRECGNEVVGKGVFCQKCGAKQDVPETAQTAGEASSFAVRKPIAKQKQKTARKGIILAAILTAIVSIGILMAVFGSLLGGKNPMSVKNDWNMIINAQEPDYNGYVKLYYEQATFTIDEQVHNDDGTGTAKVTVTTPNMRIILDDVLNSLNAGGSLSDEELAKQAQNRIEVLLSQDCEKITTALEVPLQRVDGKWKIVPNQEWNKVITNNMAEIFREYYAAILKEDVK